MTQVVTCSQCKAALSVPDDMLGKFVRCPACSTTFTAPQTLLQTAPPEPARHEPPPLPLEERAPRIAREDYDDRRDDEDDRDYAPRWRLDPAWLTVQGGLNAMFIGTLIVVGTAAVCFFLAMILGISQAGGRRNNEGLVVLMGGLICLGILVAMGGGVTNLVGKFMCLAAPDTEARGWMIGHVICLAVNVVLAVFLFVAFVGFADARQNGPDKRNMQVALALLGALHILVFLSGTIFLNLFLKDIANTFEHRALAGGCAAFIFFETFWLLAMAGLALLSLGLEPGNFGPEQESRLAVWLVGSTIIGGGGGLVSLIWSMILQRGCHRAIHQTQRSSRRRYYDD